MKAMKIDSHRLPRAMRWVLATVFAFASISAFADYTSCCVTSSNCGATDPHTNPNCSSTGSQNYYAKCWNASTSKFECCQINQVNFNCFPGVGNCVYRSRIPVQTGCS